MRRNSALVSTASAAVLVAGLIATATTVPAVADDGHAGHTGKAAAAAPAGKAPSAVSAKAPAVALVARLDGAQEVPTAGGPAVGDQDGRAVALIKVKGDRVTFALTWRGIGAPTLGHIHEGKPGVNGAVKTGLFTTAMPAGVHSAAGQTVTDAALAERLRTDPGSFYVNLHSAEFPGGAVRGQLKPLRGFVNPLSIIKGGGLRALADGSQEVPAKDPKAVGDPDGHAVTFLQPGRRSVDYSLAWVNIAAPAAGHIHEGVLGKNGAVKVALFTTPVPQNIFAVSGSAAVSDGAVLKQIKKNPTGFYSNLHTAEFPDGAVRGQLFH
ncbi:CHRD domain-containing protein [Streptomyces phyllanthi]|uniref:CHRD domain-containing protein n=1 Tax=Streptomyces phyllanthi TaxID=1803180 RepID=A0A5N8VZA1_9ACTN|nr:CHRD domain-containing protein [Streptomyces phyllanthi]MPY40573.1 CHRD domain-containing protein [Streptomyces phyllanthi]